MATLGGMMGPSVAADAVRAAAARGLNPARISEGIMIEPMPAASAVAEPDMPDMMTFDTTTACPRPPRTWPTRATEKATSRAVMPQAFSRFPASRNKGTARSVNDSEMSPTGRCAITVADISGLST